MAMREITNRQGAKDYGCSESFFGLIVNGRVKVPERFRIWAADYLDLDEDVLFGEDR